MRRRAVGLLASLLGAVVGASDELETITLRGGLAMPANGLGTCCRPTSTGRPIVKATSAYLKLGGRLVDTAQAYRNHKEIGQVIGGSGVPREDMWITSKVASGRVTTFDQAVAAVDSILSELDTPYLDLLLIHSPKMGEAKAIQVWKGLIKAKKAGKVKALGVSNFNEAEIDALATATGELPEVNQIQYHPWSSPEWHATVARLAARGVVTTAYNSLGGARYAHKLEGSALATLATSKGLSVPQLLLRWALDKGCAVIPGSSTPLHIEHNLAVPRVRLDASDLAAIEAAAVPDGWWSRRGPNKYGDEEAREAWHDSAAGKRTKRHIHRGEH